MWASSSDRFHLVERRTNVSHVHSVWGLQGDCYGGWDTSRVAQP